MALLIAFFFTISTFGGMLYTAHAFTSDSEGMFANCCRLSLNTVDCFYRIGYNIYNCRLAEVVDIICPSDDDTDRDFTEEELDRMKLRPGIEKALEKEHGRAMKKMELEMGDRNEIKGRYNAKLTGAYGLI